MRGYKAFMSDAAKTKLFCFANFEFKIGQTYTEEEAVLCKQGFHYCRDILNVFDYYSWSSVVCHVTDLSRKSSPTDGNKTCTTKLRIDFLVDGKVTDRFGNHLYFKNGRLNSYGNTPAIELINGTKEWRRDGELHRDGDMPAVEYPDGTKYWYRNGKQNYCR